MTKGNLMRTEMSEQPDVLRRIAGRAPALKAAVAAVVPDPLLGVALVGRGSSDNAAVLGRYVIELAAGRPAGLVAPSLHTRYAAAVDYRGYLVIGLSQSGETPEVVATCERLGAAGARVIAITNEADTPLAKTSDLVLTAEAGIERAVPATKTVTAQMMLVLVLAAALGDGLPGLSDLDGLADAVGVVLDDERPPIELAAAWASFDRLLVSARGLLYAAALETALKIKETARVLAEGISVADLLHGPIAAVNSSVPVLALHAEGPTAADSRALVDRLGALGGSVAVCSPEPSSVLPMPSGLVEAVYPIVATVRGQQLAYHLSIARNLDPDAPLGLTKVTRTH